MHYPLVTSFYRAKIKVREEWDEQDEILATASQEFFGSLLESHFKAITDSELYSNTEINAST